jgi:hypothetical protein
MGYDDQVQAVIDRYKTESVPSEDASGNYVEGRKPKSPSLSGEINMHRELGGLAFKHRKLSQADFMELPRRLRVMQNEGVMAALDTMASTGDMEAGINEFNKLGGIKIKSYTTREAVDPLTKLPTTEVTVRTADDQYKSFKISELARHSGTAKDWLEWAKVGETARARNTQERNVARQEARDEQRHREQMGMLDVQGRRADASMISANAAVARAERAGSAGSRQAQWAEARAEALRAVGYSEREATDIAYGARATNPRDIRAKAEALAARAKDDTGQPLSAPAQRRYAEQVYQRIMQATPGMPGLEPAPGPAAPGGATKPLDLNRYVIGR